MQIIHPEDQPGAAAYAGAKFTGEVHTYMTMAATHAVSVNNVNFSPGARTYWHSHEHGQVLLVLAGQGRVQADGGAVEAMRAGDTVWAEPGERHWHGAAPDSYVVHTAVSLGTTDWGEPVADGDYQRAPGAG